MRRVDIGNGIIASVNQIRGQDIWTDQNIMERSRLGRRVQSKYLSASTWTVTKKYVSLFKLISNHKRVSSSSSVVPLEIACKFLLRLLVFSVNLCKLNFVYLVVLKTLRASLHYEFENQIHKRILIIMIL